MLGFRQTSVHVFYFWFIRLHLPRRMNLFLFPLRTPRTRKRPPRAPTSPRKSPHGSCSANDKPQRRPKSPQRFIRLPLTRRMNPFFIPRPQKCSPHLAQNPHALPSNNPNTTAAPRNRSPSPSSKHHKITHLRGRRKQRASIHTANPPFHTTPLQKFCPSPAPAYLCIVIKTATKYKSKNRRQ